MFIFSGTFYLFIKSSSSAANLDFKLIFKSIFIWDFLFNIISIFISVTWESLPKSPVFCFFLAKRHHPQSYTLKPLHRQSLPVERSKRTAKTGVWVEKVVQGVKNLHHGYKVARHFPHDMNWQSRMKFQQKTRKERFFCSGGSSGIRQGLK